MPRAYDRFRTNSLRDLQQRRDNRGRSEQQHDIAGDFLGVDFAREEQREESESLEAGGAIGSFENSLSYYVNALEIHSRGETHSRGQRATNNRRNIYFDTMSNMAMSYDTSRVSEELKYIKSHNYIPSKFNFNKTIDDIGNNLYLGVELEIDRGGRSNVTAKFIQEFLGEENCYVMHDGSLEDGLEITTHPCTFNYHRSLPYRALFDALVNKGYKSHDTRTCGYHIHVNRNFFGDDPTEQDLCITKILYLIEKYWDDMTVIARRGSTGYAKRFHMRENESLFNLLVKAKDSCASRYMTVNLQNNKTIEFRMFKGTLKYNTFMATMEFVRNLCYLCKHVSLGEIQSVFFEEIIHGRYVEGNLQESMLSFRETFLIDYYNERREKMRGC